MGHARLVNCQSTIRQVGQALIMYANENNGWLIPVDADEHRRGRRARLRHPMGAKRSAGPRASFKVKGPAVETNDRRSNTPAGCMICPADLDAAIAHHTYALNNPHRGATDCKLRQTADFAGLLRVRRW
jgi:hypothetical protein